MYIVKKFTAKQMFDMVWKTPVLILAKQIGVSDVGLAKACRKAGIVLPPRGYWAKSESKRPKKPKPPASDSNIEFRVLDPASLPEKPKPAPAAQRSSVEIPTTLSKPHPLVKRWLAAARRAKVVEGYLSLSPGEVLDAKISKGEVDRCAILFDTLIKEAERRGYVCQVGPGQTELSVLGEQMGISIRERLERHELPRPAPKAMKPGRPWQLDLSTMSTPKYSWSGTGELSLHIDARTDYQERKNWKDTKTGRLETKLGSLLDALPRISASVKSQRDKHEEWRRKREREEAERQERMALDHRSGKLRTRLMEKTVNWERAQRLRALINATIQAAPEDEQSQQALALWVAWAMEQVELLDPLIVDFGAVTSMAVSEGNKAYEGSMYWKPKDAQGWWD
jgi:hypothetical protein